MKKILSLTIALCLLFALGAMAETTVVEGQGQGFGGAVKVQVTLEDGKITKVEVLEHAETNGIGTPGLEQMPGRIVEAGSADVDIVTGATLTSNAIKDAVKAALAATQPAEAQPTEAQPAETQPAEAQPTEAQPAEAQPTEAQTVEAQPAEAQPLPEAEQHFGFGVVSSGRIGPGKDDKDAQVYSFNQVMASVIFDKDGKILFCHLDQLEVATPNYDGASMPHFSGFPGQSALNYDSDHDAKIDSELEQTEDNYMAEFGTWLTKRARGEGYKMGTGTWSTQMDAYEKLFVGNTVEEVQEWFDKYTAKNGRPLKADQKDEGDLAKYNALSDDEKAMLADVTSAATMSLNDSHGDIVGALKAAFDNRIPFALAK
ncbi:MAG: FMN-binding protein [Clostridiales bacterium]|nr:FMN-binding protein [Clostridiales bacterium]